MNWGNIVLLQRMLHSRVQRLAEVVLSVVWRNSSMQTRFEVRFCVIMDQRLGSASIQRLCSTSMGLDASMAALPSMDDVAQYRLPTILIRQGRRTTRTTVISRSVAMTIPGARTSVMGMVLVASICRLKPPTISTSPAETSTSRGPYQRRRRSLRRI